MTRSITLPRLTFWRGVLLLLLAAGTYSAFVRFFKGLAAATNLSDQFPWGLWVGFDILCGVALAAGGFTISAIVYIFHLERFRPIVRPAILTAFLGYLLVVFALLFDLGRPYRVWHPLVLWNPHSVMFEVGWCVTLYTSVLALEFSPIVLERFRMKKLLKVFHVLMPPLVVMGILLSTLHQSSLGSFYLIIPSKLYPLWYSPYLPVFFFLTALTLGCAMTIVESFLSAKAFKKEIEMRLLSDIGKVLLVLLGVVFLAKTLDLSNRGVLPLAFGRTYEGRLFLAEIFLGLVAPAALLAFPAIRKSRRGLFASALLVVLGVVMNRLNVSITGMERSSGVSYSPSLIEISVTLMIVGIGFAVFALAARYLPVFTHTTHEPESAPEAEPEWVEPIWERPEPARRPLLGMLGVVGGVCAILFVSAIGLTDEGIRRKPEPVTPAAPKAVEAQKTAALQSFRMPADVAFPQSPDSPAPVVFRHAVHVDSGSPECLSCHGDGVSLVRAAGPRAAAAAGAMHKQCGRCHDGASAFSVEEDCEKCHQEQGKLKIED
jgi:c(7)-type cytochrome triheme protein